MFCASLRQLPIKKHNMKTDLTTTELQRICVVILKNDFGATFAQIAEVLKLKSTEAKELYMHLIRQMENPELSEKTQQTIL